MNPRAQSLGEHIRTARVAKGLGLRELARLIEMSPSYVSDIEYDRRVPSEAVLKTLCTELSLDFDDMLARAGRLGDDADRYLKRQPSAGVLLRRAQEQGLGEGDLQKLIKQVDRLAQKRRDTA